MPRKIRLALAGCGYFGRIHLQCLRHLGELCEITGIYDKNEARAAKLAAETGLIKFARFGELLESGPDAVDIVTSTESHFEIACDCLSRGLHVFVEKPLTLDLNSSRQLIELAKTRRLLLIVGYIERFNPMLEPIAEHASRASRITVTRTAKPRSGFNDPLVYDLLIHDLDILGNFCFPSIKPGVIRASGAASDTSCELELSFGKVVVTLRARKSDIPPERRYTIETPDEEVLIDLENNIVQRNKKNAAGATSKIKRYPRTNKLLDELSAFLSQIRTGSATSYDNYLRPMEIIEAVMAHKND